MRRVDVVVDPPGDSTVTERLERELRRHRIDVDFSELNSGTGVTVHLEVLVGVGIETEVLPILERGGLTVRRWSVGPAMATGGVEAAPDAWAVATLYAVPSSPAQAPAPTQTPSAPSATPAPSTTPAPSAAAVEATIRTLTPVSEIAAPVLAAAVMTALAVSLQVDPDTLRTITRLPELARLLLLGALVSLVFTIQAGIWMRAAPNPAAAPLGLRPMTWAALVSQAYDLGVVLTFAALTVALWSPDPGVASTVAVLLALLATWCEVAWVLLAVVAAAPTRATAVHAVRLAVFGWLSCGIGLLLAAGAGRRDLAIAAVAVLLAATVTQAEAYLELRRSPSSAAFALVTLIGLTLAVAVASVTALLAREQDGVAAVAAGCAAGLLAVLTAASLAALVRGRRAPAATAAPPPVPAAMP